MAEPASTPGRAPGGAPGIRLTLRGTLLAAGALVLLAFAIVGTAVPDRTSLRQIAVAGCWFAPVAVGRGQTLTRELRWEPEGDVHVVGWNPLLEAPGDTGYEAELSLFDGPARTRIFVMVQRRSPPADASTWSPAELPEGTGYRVPAGHTLTLRLRITNTGPVDFWTQGAGAQIRYLLVG